MKQRLNKLQQNNVFIHISIDHYKDGSNICFSIEFKDYGYQTSWYNDNHEFGDYGDVMEAAIKLSNWYLEKPERIKNINSRCDSEFNKERFLKVKEILKDIL